MPYTEEGQWRAVLSVTFGEPHDWRHDEVALLQTVMARFWPLIAKAQAQAALRRSEERLQLAIQAANFGIFEYNPQTDDLYWSPELLACYGLPADTKMTADRLSSFVHPEDVAYQQQLVQTALDPQSGGAFTEEFRIRRTDGQIRWLYSKGQVYFSEENSIPKPIRVVGIALDITDRKGIEERVRANERFLQSIADTMPNVLYLYDVRAQRNVSVSTLLSPPPVGPDCGIKLGQSSRSANRRQKCSNSTSCFRLVSVSK